MNLYPPTCALFVLLLTCLRPQTDPTEPKALPGGVLARLVHAQEVYCEDQFGNKHKKGCDKKFAAHLRWSEVVIAPAGETAILVENQNQGFCGSAGCALYLFVQKTDGSYAQVLGKQGDVGTLKRLAVLKEITKDHFNVQVTWSDDKGHSNYRWNGTRYATHGE
jgi:hypothetical protein